MQVEVWSDVVCPWCYIGKRRLESALERFPHRDQVEVVWRSFQLDPSVPEGETHPTLPALAAKVDFDDTSTVADIERIADEVEKRLVARHEGVRYVFLDPTAGDGRARAEAHRPDGNA